MSDTPENPENTGEMPPERPIYDGPQISIEEEMKTSYLDYAMSVIVSRAIPDLRDGLKPVHRRILYAMHETGNSHDKPYRKSARPVGDTMGKYHPHGDSAIYDALVRMAQPFSMSLPLLDGQGNFGSMDGDNPAAMRYTEVRMDKPSASLLADIEKDTVDFTDNYDGKDLEPTVLPARFPNMLVNGAGGIAVGMATNIPPHNLGEVIDGTLALIENPDLSSEGLMEYIPGPDFPTGGIMLGRSGARKAYTEGRGSVIVRAKSRIEEIRKDRYAIVLDEIPYQVNKATLIEKIAEGVRDKRLEGISSVQDESDRIGVRVVVELKRDATPEVVLNQLFRYTQMQTSFGCNMLALNGGRPEQLTLRDFLSHFITFREEVVTRRTAFELRKARERSHILCGLAVAVSNVDEVVATIRASQDPADAREKLMTRRWPAHDIAEYIQLIDDPTHKMNEDGTYNLSETQARAILELRLQRLTAMGVKEVTDELQELAAKIRDYLDILRSRERIMSIISGELTEVRNQFAVPRRTEIVDWSGDMDDEDLIEREDMVVTITASGWAKRTPLADFRAQKRGGKGLSGMQTKDEDVITNLFVANTHTQLLFFTDDGMAYKLKTWRLPQGGRTAKGKPLVNILPIPTGVSIAAIMPVDRDEKEWDDLQVIFATSKGSVRRNRLSDFTNVKANGKIAMKFEGDDEGTRLINARICDENDDVMLVTSSSRAIRFPVTDVRVFNSRSSTGVRGIKLVNEGDEVVSMSVIRHFDATPDERNAFIKRFRTELGADESDAGEELSGDLSEERYQEMLAANDLLVTLNEGGAGNLTSSHDYRVSGRGGQGVGAMKGGNIVACFPVEISDQIMLATSKGQSIRCPVNGISFRSRAAGGVKVFNTGKGESVVSVARVVESEDEEVQVDAPAPHEAQPDEAQSSDLS
ncbi:DNA gyrase subunit A [Aliiroseovarius sp. xm-m-379]|uniref:DNA gyrase subunit A n=1 Tax=unclassified Aliiroseovarius TaxID=2623558 RepID=UPI0019DF1271|nr:DNA gyrase subunit A [Aliiroseovarius sp. xm-d-517]NRP25167.1 DNA gyrase subunit A [Aliiroseovarius sp. xm-m-379]NRP33966.1 DNA gyrase subunit A [Aliiroseovarius sp. xm-a-104]NRP41562.1 DNA gyrase subunit A [Aliiroseovarius sp. xm-m-339-2]NRP44913.1 DNA gyrase subunit A [Aliiroseovarius sp. xm-m-378]NRP50856.1 DNA gyrase subunit A [Aliiroseovarius sp. xm-m-354]NRP62568.1 DNA gyrase subunit A [Aliiroseovarius sp. xm-a-151]NRP65784.1 DNA gyrase subunit A [Aliiroseovarius sp. xm-v-225]NRP93